MGHFCSIDGGRHVKFWAAAFCVDKNRKQPPILHSKHPKFAPKKVKLLLIRGINMLSRGKRQLETPTELLRSPPSP